LAVGAPALAGGSELRAPGPQIVFQDAVDAIADALMRLRRLGEQLVAIVPSWSMMRVVEA
jgi:hypothetical protein